MGYKADFVMGNYKYPIWDHCWVECDNYNRYITATQFDKNLPPVFITTKKDKTFFPELKNGAALRHLKKEWPKEQVPFVKKTSKSKLDRKNIDRILNSFYEC